MIKSITFGSSLPYMEERHDKHPKRSLVLVDKTFEFQPGLNLLVGQNGSGKSTLLEAIAKRFLCFNFGWPNIDKDTFGYMCDLWQEDPEAYWREHKFLPYVTVDADAVPYTMYASPEFTPLGQPNRAYAMCYGLGKDASEYYDKVDSHSSGEGMRNVMAGVIDVLNGGERRVGRKAVKTYENREDRDSSKKQINWLDQNVLPKDDAPLLVLLDEPERALDLAAQLEFWRDLITVSKRPNTQIIIATHSIIPLFMRDSGAHYVEMTEGYSDLLAMNAQAIHA